MEKSGEVFHSNRGFTGVFGPLVIDRQLIYICTSFYFQSSIFGWQEFNWGFNCVFIRQIPSTRRSGNISWALSKTTPRTCQTKKGFNQFTIYTIKQNLIRYMYYHNIFNDAFIHQLNHVFSCAIINDLIKEKQYLFCW